MQTGVYESLNIKKNYWFYINKEHSQGLIRSTSSTPLIIYSYSISNNFLKEAFTKLGFKFSLTNNLENATLIIGLKKYLRQNFKLKNIISNC